MTEERWEEETSQNKRVERHREIGSTSQGTKIRLKMSCQDYRYDLYCDITLCLAIKTDLHLRSMLALCEVEPEICPTFCAGFLSRYLKLPVSSLSYIEN